MPNAQLGFTEGPPAAPPDDTNLIAVIGVCSGASPGTAAAPSASGSEVVFEIDDPTLIFASAAYGDAAELAFKMVNRSKKRALLVPCAATIAAVLGLVTQVGTGPLVTMSAATGAPFDDASIIVRVKDAGAPGTGTFELSHSYSVSRGRPTPLFQSAKTIPARTQATAIGSVDLTSLTYATPGTRVGTVDLTGLTYGAGGTLAGLTLIINPNAGGAVTTTFVAPANAAAVVSQINTAMSATIASLNQQNQLVLTSTTIGASSTIALSAATSLTALGLTATTGTGVAGALDGLTLILAANTGGSQTFTFTPPLASPAALVAQITGGTNLSADVYTTANKLRIRSTTAGSSSSLNITGGTGRSALGLAIPSSAYTGAESSYLIDHLGVTVNFGSGNYAAGTTYSASAAAGKPDLTEVRARIADVYAAGFSPAAFVVASHYDATTALAMASGLETTIATLNGQQKYPRALVCVDVTETSANVRAVLGSFVSKWVDLSARGSYIPAGQNPGGGDGLRSQGWNVAIIDAARRFSSDRGEHAENLLADCDGITENEATATTKLVSTSGLSFNVIDGSPGAFFFAGGYSSALPPSRWVDQNVRDVIQRGARVVQGGLNYYVNKTRLDTNPDKTLTEAEAAIIDAHLGGILAEALVPDHAQAVQVLVSRTEPFFDSKKVSATMVIMVNPPARTVVGTIGPGVIKTTVGGSAGIAEG